MQVEQYYSDDYAGLISGKYVFYYGYEETDPEKDEWLFTIRENDLLIFSMKTSEIEKSIDVRQLDKPQDYLISGIGIWMLMK